MDQSITRQELLEHIGWNQRNNTLQLDGQREVLIGAESLGGLRRSLVNTVGPEKARGILRRFGFAAGRRDFEHYSSLVKGDIELLEFGVFLLMLKGHAHAEVRAIEADRPTGQIFMEGVWRNSYEADEHVRHFGTWHSPTCWTLEGHLSGWVSEWLGQRAITLETQCTGMGDAYCIFTVRPAEEWGEQSARFIEDLEDADDLRSMSLLEQMSADLRATQKRLVSSEAKYRALFENAADMMMLCDPVTGRIFDANRKALDQLGYSQRDLGHMTLHELHPIEEHCRLESVVGERIDVPAPSLSLTLEGRNGSRYRVEAVFALIPYAGTTVLQVIFHDVTDFIKTQQALREAQEMAHTGQIASAVAHEVRNPLSAIVSGIRLLTSTQRSDEERKVIFETISAEGERLDSTLSDFLQFARPRSPQHRPTDLSRMLNDLVGIIWGDEDAVGSVEHEVRIGEEVPLIECDGDQIRQVLWNVILNGLQAMNKKGTMILDLARDGENRVVIHIEDTGEGISPEELDKVFEPFHTTKPRGTGLGLPIARRIIQAHGGEIRLRSEIGTGTTVTISLPLRRPDGQT